MLERPPHFLVCVVVERVKIRAQGAREQDWVLRDSETGDTMQYTMDLILCPFVCISYYITITYLLLYACVLVQFHVVNTANVILMLSHD